MIKKMITLLIAVLLMTGCAMDTALNMDTAGEALNVEEQATIDISKVDKAAMLDHLKSIGFDTSEHFEEDGHLVVEGDVAFPMEELAKEIAEGKSRQYAHPYIVSQSRVTYIRIKTTSNVPSSWSSALTTAIRDWNGISYSKIRMVRVSSSSYADITISHNSTSQSYVARASFPNAYGYTGRTINFNPRYTNRLTTAQKRWTMVHEIGHCIGMRHVNKYETSRIHIPGTPVSDRGSVMHPYVQSWRGFSAGDRNAARYLYPTSGKYVVVYENPGYTGKRWIIRAGVNEANANRFLLDNKISSVRCFGGARVRLYDGTNYTGRSLYTSRSLSRLSTTMDNRTSSLRVY